VKTRHLTLPALAVLVGLGGFAGATPAFAQAAPTVPSAPGPDRVQHEHHWSATRHIEGRIAFMKAEIKITPQQEGQWDKVAQVLRDNASETDATMAQLRGQPDQPKSAVDRLAAHGRFAALKAKQTDRLLAAFQPLYQGLSPDQKQAADHLFSPHHHHHTI